MDKAANKIIKNLREFKKENHLQRIIFFGSRWKGKPNQWSDVDLVVVSPRFSKLKSFQRAPTIRLKLNLTYPVDMLCYTPKEFSQRKNLPTIVREAVRTGIEVK